MRIEQSDIRMSSDHFYAEVHERAESLQVWDNRTGRRLEAQSSEFSLTISEQAQAMFERSRQSPAIQTQTSSPQPPATSEAAEETEFDLSEQDKQKIRMLEAMLEKLTGKKFKFVIPEKIELDRRAPESLAFITGAGPRFGWGLRYSSQEFYSETESAQFAASGTVKTADGREINFSVELGMQRHYERYSSVTIEAGDALFKDPLVINFGTAPAELISDKLSFDLDADGHAEQISFVGPGSGFLALDRNNDGVINDGTELFGALSGDGFADLRTYDEDRNGWIDENDAVYDQLQIWTKDEHGADRLLAIGSAGVGAIYLGAANTAFTLKDNQQATLGRVRETGIYLRENGTVGTLQQIDIAV